MLVLGIDSSATAASVAVNKDGKLLAEIYQNTGLTHSQTILPMTEKILKSLNLSIIDLDAVAISGGPGSFTGLRIGVSTVKGICFTNNTPCISVSTLHALAYNVSDFSGVICAVMDARCNQVYNALFLCNNGKIERLCEDRAISLDDLLADLKKIKKSIILVGDGADLCYNSFNGKIDIFIAGSNNKHQRASSVCIASAEYAVCTAEELKPTYLRLPQAERELNNKKARENK